MTTHDSINCNYGPNGQPCAMCAWVNGAVLRRVEQSAVAVRARRTALLERAAPDSPTEGAVALAEAHLSEEAWYRHLPNNAMQDAEVLELAAQVETAIGNYLQRRQQEK